MAGELYPIAGEKIFIGGVMSVGLVDLVAADFASQSWTEIDGWSQAGAFGDTSALITTPLINRGRDTKQKGTANAGSMANTFVIVADDPGQLLLITAAQPSSRQNYAFKVQGNDAVVAKSSVATVTIAAPGVFTQVAHGFAVGTPIKFSTTGALPTGLVAGTTYYVATAPTADTFTVAATAGGAAITTTGSQSGVHTGTTVPTNSTRLFAGLAMMAQEQGGDANTIRNLSATIEINSNIVKVARVG